jgi:hypothetical protein
MLDRFMFITSQNPFSTGVRGQMSKYDGTRITQWGLTAPGLQETGPAAARTDALLGFEIETFDDASIFSANDSGNIGIGSVASCTVETSEIAWKGNSVAMSKGAGAGSCHMQILSRSPVNINNIIEDRCSMNVFIPRTAYRQLAQSGRAISVYFGSDAVLTSNYYRYDFQIGRLVEGWNTLIFDFSTFPANDFGFTQGLPDDTAIISYKYEILTAESASTPTIIWDNLVKVDQGGTVPSFVDSTGSVFTAGSSQSWNMRVTFIDDAGNESNSGPTGVLANNTTGETSFAQILWDDVPISANPACVRRDLYRTLAGGSEYLFLATIFDNVETSYEDTTPDASLGITTPPEVGSQIFDNSPPPSSGIHTVWKRTAFLAGDPLNPNLLYYSRFDLPEAFPFANALEFDERITGLFSTHLGLVVTTETSYWRVIGDNPDYTVDKVLQGFGGVGARAVGTARETGWVIDRDGMRLYDLRETIKISEVIRDRVDGFYKGTLEDTHSAHSRKHNGIYWLTKDASGVYSDIYAYQYMLDELRQGWFSQIVPNPTDFNILSLWEIEDANGDYQLHCGTDEGMVFELFSDNSLNWVDAAGQTRAITMEIQTAFTRLGGKGGSPYDAQYEAATGRVSPRFIELRAKENTGAAHTWTVTVETSDSASENATIRATTDIIFAFPAGVSLLRLSMQDLIPGEYVRLTVKNEEKNKDLNLMGLRIDYHLRPGQYAVTGSPAGGGGRN